MIRAVLDANVIVSAVLTAAGIPAQILDAWRTERFALLVSSPILEEVARVLEYPRIARLRLMNKSQDCGEGVQAFLEKRQSRFTGA
jgi:putative PIN family toxin of toxin-antitoxin system